MLESLKRSKTGMIGVVIIVVVIFFAIFANFISPYEPNMMNLEEITRGPVWSDTGSMKHILGTDQLGRDILSRLIYGSRITLIVAFFGTIVGGIFGLFLGSISGFFGGKIDTIIMRIADIQLAFPFILLALFIVAILGSGLRNIILVAGISGWVRYARLVRGEILFVKEMEYIEAIRALGAKNSRILVKHIIPNVISPVIIIGTLQMARIILMEAALSFLGLGVPITIPTWGRMLSEGRVYIYTSPWLSIFPGLAITLTVLGVNLLGDWLRDYLDPNIEDY